MANWESLPDECKEKILAQTLVTDFRGASVPSMGKLGSYTQVSKGFARTARSAMKRVLTDNYAQAAVILRGSAFDALKGLMSALEEGDGSRCAKYIFRLSTGPGIDANVRSSMQNFSALVASGQLPMQEWTGVAKQLLNLCMAKQSDNLLQAGSAAPDTSEDRQGLREIIQYISANYPKAHTLCVALGASADPIAVGLRMQGYDLDYFTFSKISDDSTFRMKATGIVNAKVRGWKRGYQTVLVIDALATGTALKVMKSLIGIAYQMIGGQAPNIVALALNQVEGDRPDVTRLIVEGKVVLLPEGSPSSSKVQKKIYDKGFKEGAVGRLYPESGGGVEATAPINRDALERMIVTLMSPENVKKL